MDVVSSSPFAAVADNHRRNASVVTTVPAMAVNDDVVNISCPISPRSNTRAQQPPRTQLCDQIMPPLMEITCPVM